MLYHTIHLPVPPVSYHTPELPRPLVAATHTTERHIRPFAVCVEAWSDTMLYYTIRSLVVVWHHHLSCRDVCMWSDAIHNHHLPCGMPSARHVYGRYMSGEDPYLGAELVGPAVRGIQSNGIIATAKHFILNNQVRVSHNDIINKK